MTAAAHAIGRTRAAIARPPERRRRAWSRHLSLAILAVLLAALLPVLPFDLALDRLAATLYLGLAAVGLGLTLGLGGIPSLAQGAFAATGAFTAAGLVARQDWPVGPGGVAGTLAACLAGAAAGLLLARVRNALVAAATWLITWGASFALTGFPELSGGTQGIALPAGALTPTAHYELALALVALAVMVYTVIGRSQPGIELSAARDHPEAAAAVGVPLSRLRIGSFVAAAAFGGLAGGLAVQLAGVADPTAYGPPLSIKLFIAVVIGGATAAAEGSSACSCSGSSRSRRRSADWRASRPAGSRRCLAAAAVLVFLGSATPGCCPRSAGA